LKNIVIVLYDKCIAYNQRCGFDTLFAFAQSYSTTV
jgi:hypothetical protein